MKPTILIGEKELLAHLQIEAKKITEKSAAALAKAGGEIIRVTTPKVPIDTSELRSRSFNEGPLLGGETYFQIVGYEKHDRQFLDQYAVKVHEDLTARHKVGQAKYLEAGLQETAGYLGKYIQKEMK
jgi:hypothetical protein